jgi:hypothetical protein
VCFEAEGEPDERKGIIRRQGLHANNSTVIFKHSTEELELPLFGKAFEEGSSAECVNCARAISFTRNSKSRLSLIAFGNQTISPVSRAPASKTHAEAETFGEIHGFASSPRGKFAIIVCNLYLKELCRHGRLRRVRQTIHINKI